MYRSSHAVGVVGQLHQRRREDPGLGRRDVRIVSKWITVPPRCTAAPASLIATWSVRTRLGRDGGLDAACRVGDVHAGFAYPAELVRLSRRGSPTWGGPNRDLVGCGLVVGCGGLGRFGHGSVSLFAQGADQGPAVVLAHAVGPAQSVPLDAGTESAAVVALHRRPHSVHLRAVQQRHFTGAGHGLAARGCVKFAVDRRYM